MRRGAEERSRRVGETESRLVKVRGDYSQTRGVSGIRDSVVVEECQRARMLLHTVALSRWFPNPGPCSVTLTLLWNSKLEICGALKLKDPNKDNSHSLFSLPQ